MNLKLLLLSILIFCSYQALAQNSRDLKIKSLINNKVLYPEIEKEEYFKVKTELLKFEKQYGYDARFNFALLANSFRYKDLKFFKKQITLLVKNYGLDVAYMFGNEFYYQSIIFGNLSYWFKKMYLKEHLFWLSNNFDKQIDLRILNNLNENHQNINNYYSDLIHKIKLDSLQKSQIMSISSEWFLKNLSELTTIINKRKIYPSFKSFALIQNDFSILELHNFQAKENFERSYFLLFDVYKKAYLNNEMDYQKFYTIDLWSYQHFGVQKFGLLKINELQDWYKKSNKEIPIEDDIFYQNLRKEFKWH